MINSIDVSKCTGCGTCFKTCGLDVFRLDTEQPVLSSQHGQMSGRYCPSLPKKSPLNSVYCTVEGLLRMKWDKLLPKGRSCPWGRR